MTSLALAERWTADMVEERLREALHTLSLLPLEIGRDVPAGYPPSLWPRVVQRLEDWLPRPGEENFTAKWKAAREHLAQQRHQTRIAPDARAISEMEEALSWQHLVAPRSYFQALAAHCLGEGATRTARRYHVSRETVRLWRRRALDQIVRGLHDRPASAARSRRA